MKKGNEVVKMLESLKARLKRFEGVIPHLMVFLLTVNLSVTLNYNRQLSNLHSEDETMLASCEIAISSILSNRPNPILLSSEIMTALSRQRNSEDLTNEDKILSIRLIEDDLCFTALTDKSEIRFFRLSFERSGAVNFQVYEIQELEYPDEVNNILEKAKKV